MELQSSSQYGSQASLYEENQESAYVYIRVLGKGAFGEAVLYRKVAVSTMERLDVKPTSALNSTLLHRRTAHAIYI